MSEIDEVQKFAQGFQQAADGGFNPFSLFTGAPEFHSVFLAPFSPSMVEAIQEFLSSGTGPLESVAQQFQQAGLPPAEANARAREMFQAAAGMCVVVLADEQGLSTIPQLFFGHFEESWRQQVLELCGEQFPDKDSLQAALISIANTAEKGVPGHHLFATVDGQDDPYEFWAGLAEQLLEGLDQGIFGGAADRLKDLGHWIGGALGALRVEGAELDGEDLLHAARCHLVAAEVAQACAAAVLLLSDFEPEDEDLFALIEHLVAMAIKQGQPDLAVAFLEDQAEAIDGIIGGLYELELARFKALAAAGVDKDRLLAGAEALKKADRKSFRHDLNREPLWQVTVAEPGETIAVEAAADRLDRSIAFVAKRVEGRTIPVVLDADGAAAIPVAVLDGWKAVMDAYQLLN
jgi:hypothetical protein